MNKVKQKIALMKLRFLVQLLKLKIKYDTRRINHA